ncbi:MAG: beta-1,3-glucosyltransferase [Bacteroidetes bacterium GWE2_42_24]|nr:MAG: beta-1,3-glucosyltransferase [Bacteroidetes bacterium GWE2_42_24]
MILITLTAGHLSAQLLPYKNPKLSIEERVDDLLLRMTPEEKFWQLFMIPGDLDEGKERFKNGIFGLQISTQSKSSDQTEQVLSYAGGGSPRAVAEKINAIQKYFIEETRLGIPIIPFDEALHGLVRDGATAYPQAIALAATFDTSMMHSVAKAIADESVSRGLRMILSPVINIARDVRWGRTEETYGEDPCLTSLMGTAYVYELEKAGLITSPKHFAVNTGDGGRDSYPIHLNDRILEEIYFPAFKSCINKGNATSVMTAYNSIDGSPCTASDWLLNQKLKKEWKFDGFVISDANAVGGANVLHYTASGYADAGAKAINNGLDVIFQTEYNHYPLFWEAFEKGTVDQLAVDNAVRRVLRAKFKLGLFENPYVNPQKATIANGNPDHRMLAEVAAQKSIVLLKNEGNLLPIKPSVKSITVIGTDAVEARLGGYSGKGNNKISIIEGIKQRAGNNVKVNYQPGCGRKAGEFETVPDQYLSTVSPAGQRINGLTSEFFNNPDLQGAPVAVRTERAIDFRWTLLPPCPEVEFDWFSVRCTGKLTPAENGTYELGIEGNDGYRLWIDGKLFIDNWQKSSYGIHTNTIAVKKGQVYDLKFEYRETSGSAWIKMIWKREGNYLWKQQIENAVAAAGQSDLNILVVGIEEGEGLDRAVLSLPGHQEQLIRAVAATLKPTVVIIVGGSAVTMDNWHDAAEAILDVWYPGEAGGSAVASVLFGDYNPAGRLPITFPMDEGQLPLVYNHKPTGRNDDYGNLTGKPLFPFGFGLSYTQFSYSDMIIDKPFIGDNENVSLSFILKNTGNIAGEEVVQLYIKDLLASTARPLLELKGFQRVPLNPGESKTIRFILTPDMLKMLNEKMQWVVEPGDFRILIGASSVDIRLRGTVTVK